MTSSPVVKLVTLVEAQGIQVEGAADSAPWLACDLEVASVAEIASILIAAKRTGRLDVIEQNGVRSLFFETGEYTGSTSTHPADRLGEVLWRSGRLSLDQLVIASEVVKTEGKMIGRALIDLGFMEPNTLRRALVDQAVQVFEACCLEETGHAVFRADVFHKNPIRFGVMTTKLVESAVERARDYRETLRKIGSLERPVEAVSPAPNAVLGETATALLQLVTSSRKKALTGRDLINKATLGRLSGVRALTELMEKGFVRMRESVEDEKLRVKRLCTAINLVMAALDEGGFGVGDSVREYVDKPPPAFEEAFSNLTLSQALDGESVVEHAQFITGGVAMMAKALTAVLDDALIQAKDTLPPELTRAVLDRVKALGAG